MSQTAKTTGAAGGNAKPDGATSGAATANKGRGGYGRGHSRPPRTSKAAFKGATEGLEALIYDDGPGSESKFVRNQDDDMKSHTGAMLSLGKGCVYASSTKHKINANSSTHAELVSVSDMLPQMLWTKNFVEAQGYDMGPALIYQDNQSAIKLEINGRASSGKKTRHIEIRYFFIADVVSQGNAKVVYCPTEDMLADFFTKPLQGSKFLRFRDTVLNIQGSPHNVN